MDYNKLISGMKRFGSTEQDICAHGLSVTPEHIKENVVIAPWWEPVTLPGLGDAEMLSPPGYAIGVWNIKNEDIEITYIKTGIGAPMILEGLLPLGVTPCKRVVFIGSVGSLDANIGIGDIIVPEFSVCGDGASRYLASDDLSLDVFGEKVFPDARMFDHAIRETARICGENHVRWHRGKNFSIDTIAAQFSHIDTIRNMGCNVIEMETSAAFRAAKLMSIPLVALFSVSDNTTTNKSLVSGRTQAEMEYRKFTRRELFPKIILSVFRKSFHEHTPVALTIDKVAFLYIVEGRVLSTRSKGKDAYYLPGGKREKNETDMQTLAREIKEELSVEILPSTAKLYGVFEAQAHGKAQGVRVRMTCYTAEFAGELTADSEIAEVVWLRITDIESVSPVDKLIFRDLHAKGLLL